MRIILEFIRVLLILFLSWAIIWAIVSGVYKVIGFDLDNMYGAWIASLSVLMLIFVLYRNKLQFSGFYKGKEVVKLSRNMTVSLISLSVLMLFIAPFIG